MKKMIGRMSGALAMLLVSAIFLNNESIYSVFAAGNNYSEETDFVTLTDASGSSMPSDEGTESQDPEEGTEVPDSEEEEEEPGAEEGGEGAGEREEEPGPGEEEDPGAGEGEEEPGPGEEKEPGAEEGEEEAGPGEEEDPGAGEGEEEPGPEEEEDPGAGEGEEGAGPGEEEDPGAGEGEEEPGPEEEEDPGAGEGEEEPAPGEKEEELGAGEEAEDRNPENEEETDGEDEMPSCLEDKEHEYEIIMEEESGTVIFRCVFCQREIDAETYEDEDAVLHEHVWNRLKEEMIPTCETCGAWHLNCEAEDGYGIHIFELIQEEGEPDRYRCIFCGEEKEVLDEWDMTIEQFRKRMGIVLFATTPLGESTIDPATIQTKIDNKETILIQNLADLLVLQDASNTIDFNENAVIQFGYFGGNGGTTDWDLTPLKAYGFRGIGSEQYPFRGTLKSGYDNSLRYKTSTPLFNYLATGAVVSDFVIHAEIEEDGSSPMGIFASHVVKSGQNDTVAMEKISVYGEVKNDNGTAGGLFGEVVNTDADPIQIRYEHSDSSKFELGIESHSLSVTAGIAGGMAGKTTGNVEIYQTNVFLVGAVRGTEAAGMLVGSMEQGGTLSVKGTADASLSVSVDGGGTNGGLAGKMEGGRVCQESSEPITITGSIAGNTAGGVIGECQNTAIRLENVTVEAAVRASGMAAGGIVGFFKEDDLQGAADADSEAWNQLHHIRITGDIDGGESTGGVVGHLEGANFRIGLADEQDEFNCIQVTGMVSASDSGSSAAGGMIGSAKGQYIEVHNASESGEINNAERIGGMIGSVESESAGAGHTVVKVSNVNVSAALNPEADVRKQGGIFGGVDAGSMAALDKKINVDDMNLRIRSYNDIARGYIAGWQTEALIYFEDDCEYQKPAANGPFPSWVDNIGNYGDVYKNGSWGENQGTLISYAQKMVVGTVETSGDSWDLDSEADVMRLAIMLNTEGNFAGNCFGGKSKAELLTENYLLTKNEYALEDSGIYSLNRNDDRGTEDAQSFIGHFSGKAGGRAVLKLGNCITYQYNLSLFPKAGDSAEFRNLEVNREVKYARGAAGIAIYASNNITVENVNMEVNLEGSPRASYYSYAGMFGEYAAAPGTELFVSGSRIGGSFTIYQRAGNENNKQYAGGMIARYQSGASGGNLPKISIDGLELAAVIQSDSRYTSGMITQMNPGSGILEDKVILAMKNIHIADGAKLTIEWDGGDAGGFLGREWSGLVPYENENKTESYSINGLQVGDGSIANRPAYQAAGPFGGMILAVTGRMQLKNVNINNASFRSNADRNGLLFRNGHNALIELENYKIAGAEVGAANTYPANGGSAVLVTGNTTNFSDIVGNNIGTNINNTYTNETNYIKGGIVNIISPAFEERFYIYSKHNLGGGDGGSQYARYYYNLFGTSMTLERERNFLNGRTLDASNMVIENGDQMMIWHLSQYMNSSILRYLSPYFTSGSVGTSPQVTLKGTIDLNHKSYYPTPVSGCTINGIDNAEIKFYGDKVENGQSGKRPRDIKENYMIHSGLLLSESGTVTVQGDENYLTLSGNVSHVWENSGALFSRAISGTKNIYRIRLKDCYVYDYWGTAHGVGLLIGAINDGTEAAPTNVDISWIKTEGYNTIPAWGYAGAALIGRVGSEEAENINLDFTNMKVHDKNSANGGIFSWASFIDNYQYTESTERNKGSARYLFTEEAYKGEDGRSNTKEPFEGGIYGENDYSSYGSVRPVFVTIGRELENGVEYWNVDEQGDADFIETITAWDQYLPYVCNDTGGAHKTSKDIRVNPKNVGILNGCGTYEDPYQITNAKQLLALACYLNSGVDENGSRNESYLKGWKIRKTGDTSDNGANSSGICNKTHAESTLQTYTYGRADDNTFPTQDDLRQAYYMIMDDIDLSGLKSTTDKQRAVDFVGLGTDKIPFSGVIVGKKVDGGVPVVTLPYKTVGNASPDNFGLIQYAKGAVVKDLEIHYPAQWSEDSKYTNVIRVANSGSPVIACILGGDNIIDNVKTGGRFAVKTSEGNDAAIGGYAGIVQQGSLILRNLSTENFSNFQCGKLGNNQKDMTPMTGADVPSSYPYVSAAIGKVENGFVIYEDTGYMGSEIVLTHKAESIAGVYNCSVLPFSNTYDVIRASGMEGQKGQINISQTGNNFTCAVANQQQLQLVSMAINSDSFSVYYGGGGYDKQAVCRKAKYNEVGAVAPVASGTVEYRNATGQDDKVYWHPYIYQYFNLTPGNNFGGSLETYTPQTGDARNKYYRSRLNAVTGEVSSVMTYRLTDTPADIDYDLSGYQRGFRGLGAIYRVFEPLGSGASESDWISIHTADTVFSDFRANFDGGGATVKAEMINDYAREIHTAALFNDLLNYEAAWGKGKPGYSIKNLVVTGTFKSCFADEKVNHTNYNVNYWEDRAAAVVGMMFYPWEIENVTARDVNVGSKGHAAGIVAWINPEINGYTQDKYKSYQFTNCAVQRMGDAPQNEPDIYSQGGSCGGIVGVMAFKNVGREMHGYSLKLTNCKVRGNDSGRLLQIKNEGFWAGIDNGSEKYERCGRGRSGAFIGYVGRRQNMLLSNNTKHEFQVIITKGAAGVPDVEYVSVSGAESSGGIIGEYYGTRRSDNDPATAVSISNITVSSSIITGRNQNVDTSTFGVGGIIGTLRKDVTCKIENVNVLNTDIYSAYGINGAVNNAGIPQGDLHAGGIVGSYYHEKCNLLLNHVTVQGDLENGKPKYEISSRLSHAGGLIGASVECGPGYANSGVGTVKIENAAVIGMNIQSDSRSQSDKVADRASGSATRAAGGMLGNVVRTDLGLKSIEITQCTVRSGVGAAGGVIGNAGNTDNAFVVDTVLEDAEVKECIIGSNGSISNADDNAGNGGIYGSIHGAEDITRSQKLHKISVTDCIIYGKNTGGIAGMAGSNQQIGNIWSTKTSETITVNNNRLLGYRAGGVFGTDKSRKTCFEKITVTENVIAAFRTGEDYSAAGGFSGGKENSDDENDSHTINNVTVEGNHIFSSNGNLKNQGAGGIFGYLQLTKEVYSDKTVVRDNQIGYWAVPSGIQSAMSGAGTLNQTSVISAGLETAASASAQLWNGNRFDALPANLKEADIGKYAAYFGNLVGIYTGGGHAYFLEPTVAYTDAAVTRPTVDAGSRELQGLMGPKMLSAPYAYRENIHVVYYEPDKTVDNTAAAVWSSTLLGKAGLFSEVNAEKEMKEYEDALNQNAGTKAVLDAYRLNMTDDKGNYIQGRINDKGEYVPGIYQLVYKNREDKYLSPFKLGNDVLPMVYIDLQYGMADQLLTSVMAVLTGAGGVQNSGNTNKNSDYDAGIGQIMDLSVTPYKIENGVITQETGETSIEISGDKTRWEIAYNGFDMADENGNGTFSLLTVTYSQKSYQTIDGAGTKDGEKIVLYIPVYVEERLNIDTHLKIVEGEVYNVQKAKEEGAYRKPLLANDSSYTLYLEYIYGSARYKYSTDGKPVYVDKKLEMTYKGAGDTILNDSFWKGTRLTLIDVCDSDKVYYYTVTGEREETISFDQFTDAEGNPYQYKAIHEDLGKEIHAGEGDVFVTKDADADGTGDDSYEYRDVAVEKFLIVVNTDGVDKTIKATAQDIRDFHVTPELAAGGSGTAAQDIKDRTTMNEHTALEVTRQIALDIGLIDKRKENGTDVRGTLQAGEEIVVDAAFRIKGDQLYWVRLNNDNTTLIDSANSKKYLEVGIYLTDENNQRVRLPDNTNVTVNGHRTQPQASVIKPEENLGAYVNCTEAYFYKDGKISFPMDDLTKIMGDAYNHGKESIEEKLNIVLNFANADLSDYEESQYKVWIELLRIEDKDYPAGGEMIDSYSANVDAKRKSDLACALETNDLMQLGINTYQNQTPMPHTINFKFKMDFNGVINSNGTNISDLADKCYTVTYHIMEKTGTGGSWEYVPYTGNQLSLKLINPAAAERLTTGPSSTEALINSRYVSYKFSENEIKKGTGAERGVITRELALTVKNAARMDLSNYKIVASVMVSDAPLGDIEKQVNNALSDFFVFTVAKLKTDLDY